MKVNDKILELTKFFKLSLYYNEQRPIIMKKIQCPNIEVGENVHKHYCQCCKGKQHVPFAVALKYQLRGLLVLADNGKTEASDCEMHNRIENYIEWYKSKHGYNGRIEFERKQYGEPISTLNACIDTLCFCGA